MRGKPGRASCRLGATLASSQASVALPRGLFTTVREDGSYPPEFFVENNGISPTSSTSSAGTTFVAGFVDYMAHFSDELVRCIDAVESPAQTEMS